MGHHALLKKTWNQQLSLKTWNKKLYSGNKPSEELSISLMGCIIKGHCFFFTYTITVFSMNCSFSQDLFIHIPKITHVIIVRLCFQQRRTAKLACGLNSSTQTDRHVRLSFKLAARGQASNLLYVMLSFSRDPDVSKDTKHVRLNYSETCAQWYKDMHCRIFHHSLYEHVSWVLILH